MRQLLILVSLTLVLSISVSWTSRPVLAQETDAAKNFFHKEIEPILVGRCLQCHGDARKGELDLRRRESAVAGGESGGAIVPGEPEQSLLLEYVSAGEMPPKEKLSDQQIAAIEKWIHEGAYFPDEPIDPLAITTDRRAGYEWWSLQPLRKIDPPDATKPWDTNPIDRFIHAKLTESGLQPSPPAAPRVLIRRATYDLIGLPPTPRQVQAFQRACQQETGVANRVGPLAYKALIDELLASQHYGEHWGRHWLDVVRFGESNGFERNVIHESVWPFRDYVIRSLNDDKPFNRLIMEHLAGDVLDGDNPDVAVGTAFLVCGPYDDVGNQDKDAAAQIRANTIDEMIRATSEAFIGMTVGCSRCHDHKFDPISQKDYYAMYATFAGVRHGERTLQRQPTALAADVDPTTVVAVNPKASSQETNGPNPEKSLRPPVNSKLNSEQFDPTDAKLVRLTVLATNAAEPCIDELEVFSTATEQNQAANVAAASVGAVATSSGDYPNNANHKLEHLIDGKYGNSQSWISNQPGQGWVQVELAETTRIDRILWGRDRDEQFKDRVATKYKIEVAIEPGKWKTVASSDDRQPYTEKPVHDPNELKWRIGRFRQENGPFQVFIGGSPKRRGDQVTPASLSTLARTTEPYVLDSDSDEKDRRFHLAQWIVDDSNPITPRVLANRVWHYHFGTGIVSTPSDFGFLGGRPSHPELLDDLAIELKQSGWRLKPLHRKIMLSQTYQQSSDYRADAAKVDADSRLLWRFPPRRLSGEEIRDSTLAIAGKLDTRMGGLGFRLFRYVQDNVATYHPLDKHGPDTYRRAVYHHNARAMQIDLMSEFDTPDCAFATPRRSSTTTPLQALTLMNHSFTTDMAEAFADRIEREEIDLPNQISRAFALAFSRMPEPDEVDAAAELVKTHGLRAFSRALLNSNEFIYVD